MTGSVKFKINQMRSGAVFAVLLSIFSIFGEPAIAHSRSQKTFPELCFKGAERSKTCTYYRILKSSRKENRYFFSGSDGLLLKHYHSHLLKVNFKHWHIKFRDVKDRRKHLRNTNRQHKLLENPGPSSQG